MDLIDREALQDKIWDIRTEIDSGLMLTIINHMPTVDAEPVRHGKWIDDLDENGRLRSAWRKCSFCGGRNYSKKNPYCPNCGAKMDLEGDNG